MTTTETQGKPEATIQQLNLGYNAEQDRLLLRVGLADNTELLVWLTYRITKQIWALLNGEVAMPTATSIPTKAAPEEAVAKFKQEMEVAEKLQKMDFKTEYQPRKEVVNNAAMLATSALLLSRENSFPTLELPCLEGVTVRMNLTQELILALCNMLQLTTKEARWDIGQSLQLPIVENHTEDPETEKVFH